MKAYERNVVLKWGSIFILGLLISTSFSAMAFEEDDNDFESLSISYRFEQPFVEEITIDNTLYDRVTLYDAPCNGEPGFPRLPEKGAYILLPQKTSVVSVSVEPSDIEFLGSGYNVEPVGMPIPLIPSDEEYFLEQDKEVYSSDTLYPGELFSIVDTYDFRGYTYLVLVLYPVHYIPQTGELFYYENMEVTVELEENNQIHPLFRGLDIDKTEVLTRVDNPEVASTYSESVPVPVGDSDLLIITTDLLKPTFDQLKQAHDLDGINTEIMTLSDIRLVPGAVTSQDIRSVIRNAYLNDGAEYVLLGGDADIVPAQKLFVRAWTGGTSTQMPSDLFYACLDGSYNSNDDDRWGEPTDGEDGGDVDLIAEVYVGRASVGNINEASNFVAKTLDFMESQDDRVDKNALMVGELLWTDPDTYGGSCMDELINGYFFLEGIPEEYEITKLYDRDWPGFDPDNAHETGWPKSEVISQINDGFYLINHLGHSNYGYNMKMGNDDVEGLSNNIYCFVYSQGCMAGGFDDPDNYDCIAEYFTVKTQYGAFGAIMNARYGWGVVGGTDGPSQKFHRQFIDALFGEEIPEVGKANQDSKEDYIHSIQGSCMRWCYYQLNLFGDPTLRLNNDVVNAAPEKPIRPTGVKLGLVEQRYVFETQTSDIDDDKIYYQWYWGDETTSVWDGPYTSEETASIIHNWSAAGTFQIKVRAKDSHGAISEWSEPLAIIIPRNSPLLNTFSYQIFERLLEQFPVLQQIIALF